jgi:tRNA threonylcarbamoyladenosine biosynthesis protein TsaE
LRVVRLPSPAATRRLGRSLGQTATGGQVLDLRGGWGSGKTTLAQGALTALVGPGVYRSPAFDLIHAYGHQVYHADLDRLQEEDLEAIGFDALFSEESVVILEHGERAGRSLPPDRLEVHLARGARRRVRVAGLVPRGPISRAWLRRAWEVWA